MGGFTGVLIVLLGISAASLTTEASDRLPDPVPVGDVLVPGTKPSRQCGRNEMFVVGTKEDRMAGGKAVFTRFVNTEKSCRCDQADCVLMKSHTVEDEKKPGFFHTFYKCDCAPPQPSMWQKLVASVSSIDFSIRKKTAPPPPVCTEPAPKPHLRDYPQCARPGTETGYCSGCCGKPTAGGRAVSSADTFCAGFNNLRGDGCGANITQHQVAAECMACPKELDVR